MQMISSRGDAQPWHSFRTASAVSPNERCVTAPVINRMNEWGIYRTETQRDSQKLSALIATQTGWINEWRVTVLSLRCCSVSSHSFKCVYRSPWPLLVHAVSRGLHHWSRGSVGSVKENHQPMQTLFLYYISYFYIFIFMYICVLKSVFDIFKKENNKLDFGLKYFFILLSLE